MVESKVLAAALCVARSVIEPIVWRGLSAVQQADAVPVIGYGTTVYSLPIRVWRSRYTSDPSSAITGRGEPVALGDVIADTGARALFAAQLETACGHVADMVTNETLSTDQVAALTSFVHDFGPDAFATSSLLRYVNGGFLDLACNELIRWSLVWTGAGLKESSERLRLRAAEQELLTGEPVCELCMGLINDRRRSLGLEPVTNMRDAMADGDGEAR
jgi:GH24 family phage-related lysozyme (muramidase)